MARGTTLGYRASKFVRRHWIGVSAACVTFLVLVGGIAGTTWQARIAEENSRAARQVANFWMGFFELADPLDPAAGQVGAVRRSRKPSLTVEQMLTQGSGRLPALPRHPLLEAEMCYRLGTYCNQWLQYDDALPLIEKALAIYRREVGDNHPDTLNARTSLGFVLMELGKWAEARTHLVAVVEASARVRGRSHRDTLSAVDSLARVQRRLGQRQEAAARFREALAASRDSLGEQNPLTLRIMTNLAGLLEEERRLPEAESLLRRAVELRRQGDGPEHAETLKAVNNLASVLSGQGKHAECSALLKETFEGCRRSLPEDDPLTLTVGNNLARSLLLLDHPDEAEPILEYVVEVSASVFPRGDPNPALFRSNYGDCLTRLRRYEEAERHLKAACSVLTKRFSPGHAATRKTLQRLVTLYEQSGEEEKAREYRRRLAEAGGSGPPQ
jgi:tetratricopeptide (TPR) repeat protein